MLSFDLTGPHPPACGHSFVYALVGVYYVEHAGENIPGARGLKRKTAEEVSTALKSIFCRNTMHSWRTLDLEGTQ